MAFLVIIAVVLLIGTFGILAMVFEYMQKMERLKSPRNAEASREIAQAVEALRREVADLRDTTTRYDLSFDTALQRIESRVGHLERQASAADQAEAPNIRVG